MCAWKYFSLLKIIHCSERGWEHAPKTKRGSDHRKNYHRDSGSCYQLDRYSSIMCRIIVGCIRRYNRRTRIGVHITGCYSAVIVNRQFNYIIQTSQYSDAVKRCRRGGICAEFMFVRYCNI